MSSTYENANKNNITVIDAPCGTGKTSWAIQEINSHPDQPYIYCTPLLDEINRVKEACRGSSFKEPMPYGQSKLDSFNELLSKGENIAVTHVTFLNATQETLNLIRESGYTLILDEELDVVTTFNSVQTVESSPRQVMTDKDIETLIDHKIISIGEDYKVSWQGKEYGQKSKFSEVERFAKLGRLYCVSNTLLVTVFPPEMFQLFDNVFVLTYLFSGLSLSSYFRLFNLNYSMASVHLNDDGLYSVIDYLPDADIAFRQCCKELIDICDTPNINRSRRALTKNWYDHASQEDLTQLKNDLGNYFRYYQKGCKGADIMWTCPKGFDGKLKGSGYTRACKPKAEWSSLPEREREQRERESLCFVPCNAKATNIYRSRSVLAYCCNIFQHPYIERFFTHNGIAAPDKDMFSLSCLIQWICRSRLRDGLPVSIYIPSSRIRNLLIDYMECKI